MRLPPSHCRQRHTGLIFLLESALGVLRHASSALPLPPAAHRAHLLAGERPRGPQACIFRPPTAASCTHGTSSCWRAPSGSSGMHLLASHCRQRHTVLIFLLESALGVLKHASSGLPLPPAAHMAHLLAGERPRGPQSCIFWPPTAASGTQGSSSCWRVPSGSSGMHLLASHWRQRQKVKVKVGKSLHRLNFPVLTSSFRPLFDLPDAPSAVPPTSSEWVPGRPVPKPWRF